MAVSSPLNRRYAEMPGSTGGIANRSTKPVGRAGDTSAPMPGGVQPPMMSRQDNILQSRMDGSFDTKRAAFNAAAQGQTMDEAGNIMPSTGAQPAVTPPAQFASAPDGQGGNKMVRLPTPASQSGQPGQSSPPAGGTHTLSAPATAPAPRHTTSPAMPSAGGPTLDMLTPQVSTPRAPRNLAAEEKAKNPGLGDRLRKRIASGVTPPVTRNVTSNAPSPVTPPTPSRPSGMMAAAGQIAQGMQTAMTTTMSPAPVAPSQVMPRAKAFLSAMKQQRMTPTTTTPPTTPPAQSDDPRNSSIYYQQAMQASRDKYLKTGDDSAIRKNVELQNRVRQEEAAKAQAAAATPTAPKAKTEVTALSKAVMPPAGPASIGIPQTPPLMPRMKTVPGGKITPRAKGGPVIAGKPYLVGEKGPEIIVPKDSGTVIPNHRLFPDKPIKTPAMDKLADQGKMDTLPRDQRTISAAVSDSRASRLPADPEAAQRWLKQWEDKEADKAEAGRDPKLVAEEKRLGLPSIKHLHHGVPESQWDETKVGFDEGLTRIGQTVAGLGDMVGVPGSGTRRDLYGERADVMQSYRERQPRGDGGISGGDILATGISEAPGFFNPLNKPGKLTQVGNAIWHGIRGYAPEQSLADAAVALSSNMVGEKVEDFVSRGKGLVGNVVGTVFEKGANHLRAVNPSQRPTTSQRQPTQPAQPITPKKLATRPISNAGLGVQPPKKFNSRAILAGT